MYKNLGGCMKEILVVGGAGYIGSHMCKLLHAAGCRPVVLDSLATGHRSAVRWGPLVQGNMADRDLLQSIFSVYDIAAVMHFAAFCYVGESVTDPGKYYWNNVAAPLVLLDAMKTAGIDCFIFSSSCAVYGEPQQIPITEEHPQNPISPYGRTKKMLEEILRDQHRAWGLRSTCLRYFNAAGADGDGEIGEDHRPETHLIPLVLQTALGQREKMEIYGDDFGTPDGTCIRDYIHIQDLARAHLLALEKMRAGWEGGAYNLGNGEGYSVRQVMEAARQVTGKKIPATVVKRRSGDPAVLVGSSRKAETDLGWKPQIPDLEEILRTAWNWHRDHPGGYG
jgi:UDP-glucose 4-epimerase